MNKARITNKRMEHRDVMDLMNFLKPIICLTYLALEKTSRCNLRVLQVLDKGETIYGQMRIM